MLLGMVDRGKTPPEKRRERGPPDLIWMNTIC
jgi:hypothetical protein